MCGLLRGDRKVLLLVLLIISLIGGCSGTDPSDVPGKADVSQEQAKQVAYDEYRVTEIEEVNLRHLTADELSLLNEEQSQLTPVYYVISGLVENKQVTVYVSSNELSHHFSK